MFFRVLLVASVTGWEGIGEWFVGEIVRLVDRLTRHFFEKTTCPLHAAFSAS